MRVSRLLHSFPHLRPFRVLQVQQKGDHLVLVLVERRHMAPCSLCGRMAHCQQSTYLRTLHDLPLMGVPVRLHLRVRRFVCANMTCRRRIFTEQFPALAPARARATHQRRQMTEQIGLALGGQAGSRLATPLGMPVSRATLLRQVQTRALPQQPAPRIIGIDEWAWRRGHRYGTLICDMERHHVLDMLPDRSVASVAHWFQQHPQMTTVCRDRRGLFAEAISQGAPQATQVVDRWHLLHNLHDVLEPLFTRYKAARKNAMPPSRLSTRAMRPSYRAVSPDHEATRHCRHEQNVQRYQRIHALATQHVSITAIAQQ